MNSRPTTIRSARLTNATITEERHEALPLVGARLAGEFTNHPSLTESAWIWAKFTLRDLSTTFHNRSLRELRRFPCARTHSIRPDYQHLDFPSPSSFSKTGIVSALPKGANRCAPSEISPVLLTSLTLRN